MIITTEADVLRDEGERYAARLRQTDLKRPIPRFGGIVHDFVVVNSLHDIEAAKHALLLATTALRTAFA